MNSEKQREIARKGGRAAHVKGTAHEFTADEARDAGRKGGEQVSSDRGRMAEIGRRGGLISAARRAARAGTTAPPGEQASARPASPESPSQHETPGSGAG